MAQIDTIADRTTGSAIAGKAYFETSTNKFIVFNGTAWIELDSDGTGAVGYSLDSNYELSSFPTLHLDASMLDGSNSVNNPADGAAVSTWGDKSGNGYDFTGSGSTAPVFKTSGRLGHNTVLFDGSDDFMSNASVLGQFSDEDATLIAVFHQYDTDGSVDIFDTGAYSGGDRLSPDYSSAFLSTRIAAVSQNFIKPLYGNNIFGLRIDSSTPSYELFYNQGSQYQTGSYSFGVTSSMSIGGGNSSYKFNGEISEVLLFNEALSDEDWNTVHSYLSAKYLAHSKNVLSGSYALDSTYSVTSSPACHFSPELDYLYKTDRTLASSNDDSIMAWKDKSRGLFLTAKESSLNPVLKTNHINGNNALYFNGGVLLGEALPAFENYDGSGTLIFAFDPDGDSSNAPIIFGSNSSNSRFINSGSAGYHNLLTGATRTTNSAHGLDINNPNISTITADSSGNTYKVFGNGGTAAYTDTFRNTGISNSRQFFHVGANDDAATSYPLNGYIYEILFFDSALSDSDMNAVGGYLGAKYGISYTDI